MHAPREYSDIGSIERAFVSECFANKPLSNSRLEAYMTLFNVENINLHFGSERITCLHACLYTNNQLSVIKMLVEHGSDILLKDSDGKTPLTLMFINKDAPKQISPIKDQINTDEDIKDIIEIYLQNKTRPFEDEDVAHEILWYCCRNGSKKCVAYLLGVMKTVDLYYTPNGRSYNMFIEACINEHLDVLPLFFDYLRIYSSKYKNIFITDMSELEMDSEIIPLLNYLCDRRLFDIVSLLLDEFGKLMMNSVYYDHKRAVNATEDNDLKKKMIKIYFQKCLDDTIQVSKGLDDGNEYIISALNDLIADVKRDSVILASNKPNKTNLKFRLKKRKGKKRH